jgi:hypothetical protein
MHFKLLMHFSAATIYKPITAFPLLLLLHCSAAPMHFKLLLMHCSAATIAPMLLL